MGLSQLFKIQFSEDINEEIYEKLSLSLLILTVSFTACGGDSSGGENIPANLSSKTLTSFSIVSPSSSGTINETTKTVSVTVPYETDVTQLIAEFSTTGASVKVGTEIQFSEFSENDFTNPVVYTVTAVDNSTQNYTVTVTVAPPSTNADLSALTVSSGILTPAFTAATTAYTVSVFNSVTSITVTGTKADTNASIAYSPIQPSALNEGANAITVTVTAHSGVTKVYTVTVTRSKDYFSTNIGTLKFVPEERCDEAAMLYYKQMIFRS